MGKSESCEVKGLREYQQEVWSLSQLKPYKNNPRDHPEEQIEAIVRSIEEFGFTTPILVDEGGEIIAGHGREMAARRMGLKKVKVVIAVGWTESQKRAYRIADNAIALQSDWSMGALEAEVERLNQEGDVAIDILGLDQEVLEAITQEVGDLDGGIGASEISEANFTDLGAKCPRCGFEFEP